MLAAPLEGMWSVRPFTILLLLLAAGCQRRVSAQVVDDPLGAIGCYELATERGLASTTAIDLCAGATTVAPGQCYVAAVDRLGDLTTQQIVDLCRGATSMQPLGCYEGLDARGDLTNNQMIAYCAVRCPIGPPPPQASDPRCLAGAIDRTNLSTQMAGELCLGSRSEAPVDCFVVGEEVSALSENQLVQLCTQTFSCQYINAPPPAE